MSTLQKSFDWKALLALGLGCVVGWSWVIYSGMWGSLGGTMGGVLAFVIVAILCSFVGLVYAELSSTYPKAGGEVIFSIEALGLGWARVAQWMCLLSWVGLLAVEAIGIPVILTTIGFTVPQVVPLYQFAVKPFICPTSSSPSVSTVYLPSSISWALPSPALSRSGRSISCWPPPYSSASAASPSVSPPTWSRCSPHPRPSSPCC